jgi:hypothetical protein
VRSQFESTGTLAGGVQDVLQALTGALACASGIWIHKMKHLEKKHPQFAVCINNAAYPASLALHKIYQVLPDEDAARDGDIRVIDESGEDSLYPAFSFVRIEVPRDVERAILHAS